MNEFVAGCRVVCLDAERLPTHAPGASAVDFSFPGGFIREGAFYRVEGVFSDGFTHPGLMLEGMPVLHGEREIPWSARRFQRVDEEEAVWQEAQHAGQLTFQGS